MKGYGSRTRPSEGVRQDLFVKALALQDETGATSVLVTSDLHSYTRGMSDTIADAVKTKYGVPRERLILNASHTHGGPAVTGEPWMRPSEDINAEQEAVIRRYTARLLDQIVELVGQAIGNLSPAESRSVRARPGLASTAGGSRPACATCRRSSIRTCRC